jgi:hypothetical protein
MPKAKSVHSTQRRTAPLRKPSKAKSKVSPRKARWPRKSAISDIYDSGLDLVPSKKKVVGERARHAKDDIADIAALDFKRGRATLKAPLRSRPTP